MIKLYRRIRWFFLKHFSKQYAYMRYKGPHKYYIKTVDGEEFFITGKRTDIPNSAVVAVDVTALYGVNVANNINLDEFKGYYGEYTSYSEGVCTDN